MESAYNFILNDLNIKYGDTIVIACSGGPDSMALLNLLLKLKRAVDIEIVCAHVNHNTGRSGQKKEAEFVYDFCRKHQIIFEKLVLDNYSNDNFHNEAHLRRYAFFEKLVNKYHAKYLFTAHHGDDLMETILMRLTRGSTLKGYSGFAKIVNHSTYKIVRPLINVTKEDILNYCKQENIPFKIDSSNKKDVYTRNRFRKYIIPLFKKEDPTVHEKFYKFSVLLQEYSDYIDTVVEAKKNEIIPNNILNIDKFKKEEHLIQMRIIFYLLEQFYKDELMLVTFRHANLIYDLIYSKKANAVINLPNNVQAKKMYDNLILIKNKEKTCDYELLIENCVNLPNGKKIEVLKSSEDTDNFICYLDSHEITLPLYVRNRKDGDKMRVLGMKGSKKIKDIFIDSKVPTYERELWPVVIDSKDNIVWLPGLKKSQFDKTKQQKYDIILKYY